jgi:hypothetical protein
VSRAIARALARSEGAHISIRGEAQCGIAAVEIACVAGVYDKVGPVLLCSPYTLSRIVTAAAWYTTEHAADPGEDYESFRLRHPSHLGLASLQASKSLDEGRSQTTAIEALRKESEQAESGEAPTAASSIFEAILTLTFAAIIGHESSHLETVPPFCAVEQRSRLEENGTWDVLLRVEMSGELFQAGSPVREEVVADRCAMRRIRLARSAIDSGPLDERNKEFSRRAAADIISTLLFFRLAPEDSSPVVWGLGIAGVFHQWERDTRAVIMALSVEPPNPAKLERLKFTGLCKEVEKTGFAITTHGSYATLRLAGLVANTIKHGNGRSFRELVVERPNFFQGGPVGVRMGNLPPQPHHLRVFERHFDEISAAIEALVHGYADAVS